MKVSSYESLPEHLQSQFNEMKDMVNFFIEHGFIPSTTRLKVSDLTQCYPREGLITIDFDEIATLSDKMLNLSCGQDDELMVKFWDYEITLCHELGHLIDFNTRLKGDMNLLHKEMDKREAVSHARNVLTTAYLGTLSIEEVEEKEDFIEILEEVTYRALPLEREADRIAYELLKYYAEHENR